MMVRAPISVIRAWRRRLRMSCMRPVLFAGGLPTHVETTIAERETEFSKQR
jgi:hypothetical protein